MNEVRRVFKEELDVQMENEITTDRIHDIEEDALSAAGEEHDESNEITEFKPSQVPGEGFVAAARHNDQAL